MDAAAPSSPGLLAAARRRVLIAFASFALGLVLARALPSLGATLWFAAALGLCAAAIPARAWACRTLLVLACAAISAGWYAVRIHEQSPHSLAARLPHSNGAQPQLITVEGVLLDTPRVRPAAGGALAEFYITHARTRFDLRVTGAVTDAGVVPVGGRLWVTVAGADIAPNAGDRVRVTGLFSGVEGPLNPGESDMRTVAAQSGYCGLLALSGPELIATLPSPPTVLAEAERSFLRVRAWLQGRAREVVRRAGGADAAGGNPGQSLLSGLILGDYDTSQPEVRDAFARQGLAHVLSISGFHLAVMAWVALSLVRLTGDRGWVEPAFVALIVIAYLLVVPASAPIMRSAAMVLVLLLAEASGRRYDRLTLLGWIAIGLLIWRPADLWSLGYQLSLGLTGALFWLGGTFKDRIFGAPLLGTLESRDRSLPRWLADSFKTAASAAILCWVVSAPLIILRIGLVSPLAIIATVLVTPLITLALWIGYIALLLGSFLPASADLASGVLGALSSTVIALVQTLDRLPMSTIRVPPVSVGWAVAATLVALYWCRKGHTRDWRAWAGSGLVAGWFLWLITIGQSLPQGTPLRIDTFAVGDGTCHLIRSGDQAMLWDCGSLNARGIQPVLVEAVRAVGGWKTPIVVVSHPDIDHFGALLDLAEPLGIETVIASERLFAQAAADPTGSAAALLSGLAARKIDVRSVNAGDFWRLGHCEIRVLSPPRNAWWSNDNDHSLVASFTVDRANSMSLLLTGDIQDDAIEWLMENQPHVQPRILELPHHGSARPAAIQFVANLAPAVVLQSTGRQRLGDPRWDFLRAGRWWYCTAESGAAWAEVRADGAIVSGAVRSPKGGQP